MDIPTPIVVDLKKRSRKKLKMLERGEGPLPAEVMQAVEQCRAGLGPAAEGLEILPVVVVYDRKRKRGAFAL